MGERTGDVWRGRGDPDAPLDDEESGPETGPRGGRGRGVTGLVALAISGIVLYVAWCVVWERDHPAGAAARGIRRGDAPARLKAIREVEHLGPQDPEAALPALVGALDDPEPGNRGAAAECLVTVIHGARLNDSDPGPVREAVAALMDHLGDPQPMVRVRVLESLARVVLLWRDAQRLVDLDAIESAMGRSVADPEAEVRLAAVRGLAMVGDPRHNDEPIRLLAAALEDESEPVRIAAAQALALHPHEVLRMLPALVKSLESTRAACRPAYLNILEHLRPEKFSKAPEKKQLLHHLVAALGSRDREVRCRMLSSIGDFGPEAREVIPTLLAVLDEPVAGGSADPGAGPSAHDPSVAAGHALARVAGIGAQLGGGRGDAEDPTGPGGRPRPGETARVFRGRPPPGGDQGPVGLRPR